MLKEFAAFIGDTVSNIARKLKSIMTREQGKNGGVRVQTWMGVMCRMWTVNSSSGSCTADNDRGRTSIPMILLLT